MPAAGGGGDNLLDKIDQEYDVDKDKNTHYNKYKFSPDGVFRIAESAETAGM